MLADQINEINTLRAGKLRLQFTLENKEQTQQMLEVFGKTFVSQEEVEIPEMEFTRGHFKRGVK